MNKVLASAAEAVALVPDGATIMMGGFGVCGLPENLIDALHARGTRDLTLISNNAGLGGFFAPRGYCTVIAEGKEPRVIDGKPYVLEAPLHADFAFVRAWKGDRDGNLVYRKTARNFNPIMATAARVTIAEVEHLVEPGEIDPDYVHTPGIFVRYIFQGSHYEKRIEKRTTREI